MPMVDSAEQQGSKVPQVTLVFWIIKIAATTLGETFGDTVTMTLNSGYLVGTVIFFSLLIALVVWQIAVKGFHPFLLLGDHHCLHNSRHDYGRFRGPFFGPRLRGRVVPFVGLPDRRAWDVVPVARLHFRRHRQYA